MKKFLRFKSKVIRIVLLPFILLTLSFASSNIHAQPSFSKSFDSNQIGPGSVSTLIFTIDNSGSASPASELAFTDVLPAGVVIAIPANASISNPTGTLTAPDGGGSITYSGGSVGAGTTLIITVDVTSSTIGTHTNTTSNLSATVDEEEVFGNPATDDLTVSPDLPGFSKSFSPSTINLEERSTLTFFIDNTANASGIAYIDFTDNLPSGMVVANPANTSISFVGGSPLIEPTLTAEPGSGVITYDGNGVLPSAPALAAGATLTISVDVYGNSAGSIINVTELLADFTSCGNASAVLEVSDPTDILIQKSFSPNPVQPGGTTNLEFTLSNFTRDSEATNITFTDDLGAVLSGLVATGLPLTDICGTGSQISGTSTLNFTGGTIEAEGSVSFSVPLQIPAGAAPGEYINTTSAVTATIDGATVTGNAATEYLYITNAPTITKTFLDNPVLPGETATLEFTITNVSSAHEATNITFTDDISAFMNGATISTSSLPSSDDCGPGSTFSVISADPWVFQMANGTIAAGGSYTFTIDIVTPTNVAGNYTNTTSQISATLDGEEVSGNPATDDLDVIAVPQLSMSFTDDPVLPGGTATLEFTITYSENASGNATNINFTDDLDAVISGLVATGLPVNDVCGTGSQLSGTSSLSLTGGVMSPGESFTFTVPVEVPPTATYDSYPNTTSVLSAIVSDQSVTSPAAEDDLDIAGLIFTKEFIDDPTIPGALVTLRYTINNTTSFDATSIIFTDNLAGALSGFEAELLPGLPCGASFSGTSTLIYSGGAVPAGNSCSFEVLCRVPANAESNNYNSASSYLTASMNGTNIIDPATDVLEVNDNLISFSKSFTDDPVEPGSTVTLEYTITNLNPDNALSNIAFTDDLDATLSGLEAVGLPETNCGGTLSGSSTIDFSGGSLAAGATCMFSVTLLTPSSAPYGGSIPSTTSSLTGEINGFSVYGDPASDNLDFTSLEVNKAFSGSVIPGETATLTFTLTNPDASNPVSNIRFTDDLDAFISGASATNLPLNDVVGEGSSVSGTSTILFEQGVLAAGETASFDVDVLIPCGTPSDTYLNTTSTISADGNDGTYSVSPASDNLTINSFTVGSISSNQSICYSNTPEELTGTPPTGGVTAYSYQWQSSTDNSNFSDISGATSINYQPGDLTTTTYFRQKQTSGSDCETLTTNTVTITIYDENPVVRTHDITIELDGTGMASISPDDIDNGSTDDCGIDHMQLDQTGFDCSHVGNNTVTLTVTDVNGNDNSADATVTVEDSYSPSGMDIATTDLTCYQDGSGQIEIIPIGGQGSMSFSIDEGTNWQSDAGLFTGLNAGNFTVMVEAENGCQNPYGANPVVITQPTELVIDGVTSTNATSNNVNNGTITITASSGTGDIMYSINGGGTWQSDGAYDGLAPGNYSVMVKDANGCITVYPDNPVTIFEPQPLVINDVAVDPITCHNAADGSIEIEADGGAGEIQYSIDGGSTWFNGDWFIILGPGSYTVQVKDQNDNVTVYDDNPVILTNPPELIISDINTIDPSCNSSSNGEIIITATGGTGTIMYSINAGESWQDNGMFSSLSASDYSIAVKDANGCITNYEANPVPLTDPPQLTIEQVASIGVICYDNGNGTITITAQGGSGTLIYSINDGQSWQPESQFSGLTPGSYFAWVKDQNDCMVAYGDNPVEIIQAGELLITNVQTQDASHYGASDGQITVTATGGIAPYLYSIDDGESWQSSNTFGGLTAGSYTVWVKDQHDCMSPYSDSPVVIDQPSLITITGVTHENVTGCYGNTNGTITIEAGGEGESFFYSINGGGSWHENGGLFEALPAGEYEVMVKDVDDNTASYTNNPVLLTQPEELTINQVVFTDVTCYGNSDGAIFVAATGDSEALMYSVNDGQSWQQESQITGLSSGSYTLWVKDQNGCTTAYEDNPIDIPQPGELIITDVEVQNASGYDQADGLITIGSEGGTTPYEYSINGGGDYQLGDTFTELPPGDYQVMVNDANGCVSVYSANPVTVGWPSEETILEGQVKFFNEQETPVPGEMDLKVALVDGQGNLSQVQSVGPHPDNASIAAYYHFEGVVPDQEYTLRMWEEAQTLGDSWQYNSWGGVSSADALIISYMVSGNPNLAQFPWILPQTGNNYTPLFSEVADANNSGNLSALDALLVNYRLVGFPGTAPFPNNNFNHQVGGQVVDALGDMVYDMAPEKVFSQSGTYQAGSPSSSVYYEGRVTPVENQTVFNIYWVTTGDVNATYTPGSGSTKSSKQLSYKGQITAAPGAEITIPVISSKPVEAGALTLGLQYDNTLIKVTSAEGYDVKYIDHDKGIVRVSMTNTSLVMFDATNPVVKLKAKVLKAASPDIRYMSLEDRTELVDAKARTIADLKLEIPTLKIASPTSVGEITKADLSHAAYPNPFDEYTRIRYSILQSGKVSVQVYDNIGREVAKLNDRFHEPGTYNAMFKREDANGPGVYIYRIVLESTNNTMIKQGRMILLK